MFAYAALLVAGGVMGYVKAKSVMSLVMSLAAAIAIVFGVMFAQTNKSAGYGICGAVALALSIFFGYRFATTGSMMPGLPALVLSVVALGLLAYAHLSGK